MNRTAKVERELGAMTISSPKQPPLKGEEDQKEGNSAESFSFSRNSPKHEACLALLVQGFTQAYVDLFYLSHRLKDAVYGPGGEMITGPTPVDLPPEELTFLSTHLTRAETATRIGESATIYSSYLSIARHFEKHGDFKLAIFFHEKCLHVAKHALDKDSEGGAHSALAVCYEKLNDLENAIDHHERHLRLAKRAKNEAEEARGLRRLFSVYERYANQCETSGNWEGAVKYHGRCMETAKEIADEASQGKVELRLGLANRKLAKNDVAAKHFERYLDTALRLRDNDGACVACHNLAKTYKDLGETQSAVEFLERLLELSQQAEHRGAQADACSELGTIFNNKTDYSTGLQYFEEAFDLARTVAKQDKIEQARVQVGIAKGNASLDEFIGILKKGDPAALIKWRQSRAEAR